MIEDNHVTLRLPTPLRPYADQRSNVELGGATVGEAVANLVVQYPALRRHLLDEDGSLRKFVHLYLNGEDIYERDGEQTSLAPGDKLAIVPAIAGGCRAL